MTKSWDLFDSTLQVSWVQPGRYAPVFVFLLLRDIAVDDTKPLGALNPLPIRPVCIELMKTFPCIARLYCCVGWSHSLLSSLHRCDMEVYAAQQHHFEVTWRMSWQGLSFEEV